MSTGELRAFRQSEVLEGEKKRHNLGKTQQVINMSTQILHCNKITSV